MPSPPIPFSPYSSTIRKSPNLHIQPPPPFSPYDVSKILLTSPLCLSSTLSTSPCIPSILAINLFTLCSFTPTSLSVLFLCQRLMSRSEISFPLCYGYFPSIEHICPETKRVFLKSEHRRLVGDG